VQRQQTPKAGAMIKMADMAKFMDYDQFNQVFWHMDQCQIQIDVTLA
tara:strand:- start:12 stop:152 length:141 start_codon:yes stop_codon:yes gene_type:complete